MAQIQSLAQEFPYAAGVDIYIYIKEIEDEN